MKRHHSARAPRWPTGRQFALLFSLLVATVFTIQNLEHLQFLREVSASVKFGQAGQVNYDWSAGQLLGVAFWTLPIWIYAFALIGSRATARTPLALVCFLANVIQLATWGMGMMTAYRVANGY